MHPSLQIQILLGAAFLAAAPAAAEGADLNSESPFLPAPGAGGRQAQQEPAALELRGVLVDRGTTLFNIVNTATKRGAWVALRETGAEYVVKTHEIVEDNDSVTVEHQGRTLRLALAKPKTRSSGAAQLPAQPMPVQPTAPVAAAQPQPGPQPGAPTPQQEGPISPVVLNPTPADEARRLEAVAAEVRRRRALRQQSNPVPGSPAAPAQP